MAGRYRGIILEELPEIIDKLVNDIPLPARYLDHDLTGNWSGHRECHIRPNLLLVYQKIGDKELYLARLGSHSEIFG
jgi:mRNA interferase YafQ